MIKKEDAQTINQLLDSLDLSLSELEKAHSEKDSASFNKSKKFMIDLQKKISEVIK